jgi:hypothetical protein
MYGRFALGLRGYLRETLSVEQAREIVARRLAARDAGFLQLIEKGVYGYARSPYLSLLRLAQVELGDIRTMLRARGVEGTLRALREAGVYVTFEEFKGREPLVRHGREIAIEPRDFDNPFLSCCYQTRSGGTTGAGTRVTTDLAQLAAIAPNFKLAFDAYGVLGAPAVIWRGVFPDGSGIGHVLLHSRIDRAPEKWFTPFTSRDLRPSLKYRLAHRTVLAMTRASGGTVPEPEPLRLEDAARIARWMARSLKAHPTCVFRGTVSMALRVCIAAAEEDLRLEGAVFMAGGEPPTPAKVRQITRTGARWVPTYWFVEAGPVGIGCASPADVNDTHLLKDCLALIQHPRRLPGAEETVDAFYFTTLLPTAPKLLLNAESDDYGVIEQRSCGCPFEALGYTEHLRQVRSFRKLTGEGVTLVGSEMVHILEEVLPGRFGGSPLDYQLLEEEDERGFTRLCLLVSPRIAVVDDREVIDTVMDALKRSSASADLARTLWRQAGSLRVKRGEPVWTARGKMMPLHVAGRPAGPPAR